MQRVTVDMRAAKVLGHRELRFGISDCIIPRRFWQNPTCFGTIEGINGGE
jgi:hypothetical protein